MTKRKPPEQPTAKPMVKETRKSLPFFKWKCNWIVGKRSGKRCGFPIEGQGKALVDRSSDQHWAKHKREITIGLK